MESSSLCVPFNYFLTWPAISCESLYENGKNFGNRNWDKEVPTVQNRANKSGKNEKWTFFVTNPCCPVTYPIDFPRIFRVYVLRALQLSANPRKCDPFVIGFLGNDERNLIQTQIEDSTRNPEFYTYLDFEHVILPGQYCGVFGCQRVFAQFVSGENRWCFSACFIGKYFVPRARCWGNVQYLVVKVGLSPQIWSKPAEKM